MCSHFYEQLLSCPSCHYINAWLFSTIYVPCVSLGLRCHLEDACVSNPCKAEGSICDTSPLDGNPICSCKHGWTGNMCETDINECTEGKKYAPQRLQHILNMAYCFIVKSNKKQKNIEIILSRLS